MSAEYEADFCVNDDEFEEAEPAQPTWRYEVTQTTTEINLKGKSQSEKKRAKQKKRKKAENNDYRNSVRNPVFEKQEVLGASKNTEL